MNTSSVVCENRNGFTLSSSSWRKNVNSVIFLWFWGNGDTVNMGKWERYYLMHFWKQTNRMKAISNYILVWNTYLWNVTTCDFTYWIKENIFRSYGFTWLKMQNAEAAFERCSYKKVFWNYAENLQENTHAKMWFQ